MQKIYSRPSCFINERKIKELKSFNSQLLKILLYMVQVTKSILTSFGKRVFDWTHDDPFTRMLKIVLGEAPIGVHHQLETHFF